MQRQLRCKTRASHRLLAKVADSWSRSSAPRLWLLVASVDEPDGSSEWALVLAIHDLSISFSFMPFFYINILIPASAHTRSTRTMCTYNVTLRFILSSNQVIPSLVLSSLSRPRVFHYPSIFSRSLSRVGPWQIPNPTPSSPSFIIILLRALVTFFCLIL